MTVEMRGLSSERLTVMESVKLTETFLWQRKDVIFELYSNFSQKKVLFCVLRVQNCCFVKNRIDHFMKNLPIVFPQGLSEQIPDAIMVRDITKTRVSLGTRIAWTSWNEIWSSLYRVVASYTVGWCSDSTGVKIPRLSLFLQCALWRVIYWYESTTAIIIQ